MTVHVLGISGSLRQNSYNTALLRAATELLPADMELTTFDLRPIPLYDGDLDTPEPLPVIHNLRETIRSADALLIATPEYNFSIPGVLKNALDWASRPIATNYLDGKPLAILGAGGRMGTIRAQHHLRQIAAGVNMLPVNRPEVAVIIPGSFDDQGNLINPDSRQLIRTLLQNLHDWTVRLKG